MFHKPATPTGKDPSSPYKAKIGVRMFALYCLVYIGFVVINLAYPTMMETTITAGLNLAVFYGFFLIGFALFLALIYNHLCTTREAEMLNADSEKGGS
jgi:TRAP-type C4-dicarboxylate transport system permease small subunit